MSLSVNLLGVAVCMMIAFFGYRMAHYPDSYFGKGTPPSSNPALLVKVGRFHIVFGALAGILITARILYHILPE